MAIPSEYPAGILSRMYSRWIFDLPVSVGSKMYLLSLFVQFLEQRSFVSLNMKVVPQERQVRGSLRLASNRRVADSQLCLSPVQAMQHTAGIQPWETVRGR